MKISTFLYALAGATLLLIGLTRTASAAEAAVDRTPVGVFNPLELFAPLELPQPANAFRDGSGRPGPLAWQNRGDYDLHATIDPATHGLQGEETITYTNHSPDALDVLWLQLDQNIYRADSRAAMARSGGRTQSTNGFEIASIEVDMGGKRQPVETLVDDTRMRVDLPQALAAKGGTLRLHIRYRYTVPGTWGGRTAVTPSRNGEIFEIAQWYPRMAVYDDLHGWDTQPYLGSEFYLEYGDFDYAVTVPWDYLVAGSGGLVNGDEVLTATQRTRLAEAAGSDRTVMIRAPDEVGAASSRPTRSGTQTWRFHMEHTRDVAFAASPAFVWDAARINLPGGQHSLAMSVYPVEAVGKDKWDRSTEFLKGAVENFSQWYPYPWPAAVNLGGHGAGMEYPGIVFDGMDDAGDTLFWITAHEIGHTWFPMIVGSNERRHAFMDEGFNTFIDVYASDAFNNGEFAPKRDSEYAPGGGNPVDEILPILADPAAPPILSRADTVIERWRHPITYFKSALGLKLLREEILGPERFDPAFRRFIAAWAYRHPKPADFFRAMESEAGEDLSWWWRGWYAENWRMDLAVAAIEAKAGSTLVRVETRDRLVMPATLRVTYADGRTSDIRLPAEAWIRQASIAVAVPAGSVVRAELDPDHRLPDRDRRNNVAVVR